MQCSAQYSRQNDVICYNLSEFLLITQPEVFTSTAIVHMAKTSRYEHGKGKIKGHKHISCKNRERNKKKKRRRKRKKIRKFERMKKVKESERKEERPWKLKNFRDYGHRGKVRMERRTQKKIKKFVRKRIEKERKRKEGWKQEKMN